MPMPLVALADHLPLQRLQCSEKRCSAITLVVVGHRAATTLFDRQTGLSPIQRLNLALFVHAQDDRLLRRIQVQSDHVGQFLQELGVAREFECLDKMRLQIVGLPDIVDGGLADTLTLGHRPATPMRHSCRFGLQSRLHYGGDLVNVIDRLASATWGDLPQSLQALFGKPRAPA